MTELSAGKLQGMTAVADQRGVIRAAAMDQRGSLKKALSKAKGSSPESITDEMMSEFKETVIETLSPHASGVLLDPEYGLQAAKRRHEGVGLLLAHEKSGYDNAQPGRIPVMLSDWPPARLKETGADAVKLLVYYSPLESDSVNDQKKAMVAQVGSDCSRHDIPFFLEFVGYDHTGEASALEYARSKPNIVTESIREFSRDEYQVDVLKVEIPVDLRLTEGTESYQSPEPAYSLSEAKDHYLAAAAAARCPFIYLSAGVGDAQFRESLRIAVETGVKFSGVLCGRATWQEGIPIYAQDGREALQSWLADQGAKNIQALNEILTGATSWKECLHRTSV